ncbi:type II toxin-antitoxin system HicA family toxin [Pleomorphomonas koreensis]|uniref:type II toxin-antitoxin system HicA family toxin n=1 Tax=Pleomorphomonas koreensis TaxID=257440 RepID=UPI0003F89532|nr:type II toxin-antitoxin system HicA family toxin [Pleomorphomonas koreensis]
MVRGFYAEIVETLKTAGCTFKRAGKGDHEIWFSPITNQTFTVDRSCMSRHTANAIMKQAGLVKKF